MNENRVWMIPTIKYSYFFDIKNRRLIGESHDTEIDLKEPLNLISIININLILNYFLAHTVFTKGRFARI